MICESSAPQLIKRQKHTTTKRRQAAIYQGHCSVHKYKNLSQKQKKMNESLQRYDVLSSSTPLPCKTQNCAQKWNTRLLHTQGLILFMNKMLLRYKWRATNKYSQSYDMWVINPLPIETWKGATKMKYQDIVYPDLYSIHMNAKFLS